MIKNRLDIMPFYFIQVLTVHIERIDFMLFDLK